MESLVHYSNPSHALSVLGVLNEQRLRGQMCDVILIVADQRYQAHKSVLAASSEYFQSLFTRMGGDSLRVVNLDFCEPDAFEMVLNYIYSSSLFVDKGSLAAIQELGYSLGIPFLTNIVSTRPHASYCVSRKRLSYSEGDENDRKSRYPYSTILKGNLSHIKSVRPQLTSSVSFSDADVQHVSLQSGSDQDTKEEIEELDHHYHNNVPFQGQARERSQATDRSGPLIKSLLRRSLSMDSPVPVFSPTLELKDLQNREQSVVKIASKASGTETNKQGLQSPSLAKKRSRSSFVCPYCGKVFVFQSQYRLHLRTHPAEKANQDTGSESVLYPEQDEILQQNNTDTGVYSCRLCNVKLSSLVEQGDHERGCRHATVCPYCGLRFSSPVVKKDHEAHCRYKKLTCLECMRTFKSSFSIWRHQVEVHNQNMMTGKNQIHLKQPEIDEEALPFQHSMCSLDKISCAIKPDQVHSSWIFLIISPVNNVQLGGPVQSLIKCSYQQR
uniref:Zinc finger and BTB domain containing 21 n=1 Tax=Xiphophorus couchianus TaxID=32473 RepID=A0A3B5KSX8_9TELE